MSTSPSRASWVLLSALVVATTTAALGHARDGGTPSLSTLRSEALATVKRHCVPCHDGGHDGHVAAAIAVFDTRDAEWYATMSAAELRSAAGRVDGKAEAARAAGFRAFVRAELDRRKSS